MDKSSTTTNAGFAECGRFFVEEIFSAHWHMCAGVAAWLSPFPIVAVFGLYGLAIAGLQSPFVLSQLQKGSTCAALAECGSGTTPMSMPTAVFEDASGMVTSRAV